MKSMKSRIILGSIATVAGLVLTGGSALAQIANTKHNLGSTQPDATANQAANVTDLCVFCHTPHGSATGASVPLWNRVLPLENTFTTYDQLGTSSLDGTILPVGSVSIACLSCHDGAQALDSVINAPGSGGFNPAGARIVGSGLAGANLAADGSLADGIITNLGKDLQDDHPVGIQYAGFQLDPVNNAGVQIDADFWTDGEGLATTTINNVPMWWIDTENGPGNAGNGTREKTDLQLYTRLNGAANQPFVECASCHDPHIQRETFLRIDNTGSLVCRTCHDK